MVEGETPTVANPHCEATLSVYPDGTKAWYLNNKYHREDGPAVIYPDGTEEYWLSGEKLDVLVWLVKLEAIYG